MNTEYLNFWVCAKTGEWIDRQTYRQPETDGDDVQVSVCCSR